MDTKIQFRENNCKEIIAWFKELGFNWIDIIKAHGAISKGWFSINEKPLNYGDYIVYDSESKKFDKKEKKEEV